MKHIHRIVGMALAVVLLTAIVGQLALAENIYGKAIMNISTRSGPSTKYQDTGTYQLKGQWLQILSRAYDDVNEIWWVKVVIPTNGRALWTGYKRFDHDTLPLNSIPIEGEPESRNERPGNRRYSPDRRNHYDSDNRYDRRNRYDNGIYGLAIMKISTRSGPSTKYQDTGTYDLEGEYLEVLARAYDDVNEIWWVKVVIPTNERALWTGYKRFDHSTLPLDIIPIERW